MSIKYKIEDAKKNKNLINDEIKLSKIKSKGGPGGRRKPPKSKAPSWFIEFRDEQREFNKSIREDLNRVIKLNNLVAYFLYYLSTKLNKNNYLWYDL